MRFLACLPNRIPVGSTIAVFCFEKSKRPVGSYLYGSKVEKALEQVRSENFLGKNAQVAQARPFRFGGLGPENEATVDHVRRAAAVAARSASASGARALTLRAPQQLGGASELAQAVAEGIRLGLYRFIAY